VVTSAFHAARCKFIISCLPADHDVTVLFGRDPDDLAAEVHEHEDRALKPSRTRRRDSRETHSNSAFKPSAYKTLLIRSLLGASRGGLGVLRRLRPLQFQNEDWRKLPLEIRHAQLESLVGGIDGITFSRPSTATARLCSTTRASWALRASCQNDSAACTRAAVQELAQGQEPRFRAAVNRQGVRLSAALSAAFRRTGQGGA
jgi:hypothetical protein